jgi:NAD(P)-dependent dehydrogenase (short-subunit alcohol dehydrogenase family)
MLDDKVVVVTGGAGLLGRFFAKGIVENNGKVIICDINSEQGNIVKKDIISTLNIDDSDMIEFYNLDINSIDSILEVIEFLDNKYGKIDAWVNNAYPRNKNYGNHFFDVEYNDFNENIGINLGGYFLCCQQISKYFLKQGYGNIVNVSSIYGVITPRFEVYEGTPMTMPVEYSVIKSGLTHLTKYIAKYLKDSNIRVNLISPGGILDKQPQSFINNYRKLSLSKGMLDSQDLVGSMLFLLSDHSKFINGQNIIVDDGYSL